MQQGTSKQLYNYWNSTRVQRLAPQRSEIEPARITALLPEMFILECSEQVDSRVRLAGTRICEFLGRELRGTDLLDLWQPADRDALTNLLHNVRNDGAVAITSFVAHCDERRQAEFEMTFMPLIHMGTTINRILGNITAIQAPFWLGTTALEYFELKTVNLIWPDGTPQFINNGIEKPEKPMFRPNPTPARPASGDRPKLVVYEGGLSNKTD